MPIHVQILEEGEGAEDSVLGVIWSFYWQMSQSRDRRKHVDVNPDAAVQAVRPQVDAGTGLPMSANDLRGKAWSDSGLDLMFSAVIPPVQLARASTYWWRDEWKGDKVEILAQTPRGEWTDQMLLVYEENLRRLKRRVHLLAEDLGWFDVRPINERDGEMNDLDWVGEDRMTIGFRITHKGWEECRRWIQEYPIWGESRHLLDVSTDEIKKNAPEWFKTEHASAPAFDVSSAGFDVH